MQREHVQPSTLELRALRARMSSLRAEAEPLNNPGTFAAFSKLQRQLSKLETEEKVLAAAPPAPLTIVQRGVQQLPLAIQVTIIELPIRWFGCDLFSLNFHVGTCFIALIFIGCPRADRWLRLPVHGFLVDAALCRSRYGLFAAPARLFFAFVLDLAL